MTSLTTYANVQRDCIQLVNCIQLANMRFSLGKALFEWGIERLRVITVIVGLCSPPPTVVFPDFRDWRAALSSVGPAALHYSSDLLDRWLGNIKSLLSAGAGPGSGGGDWGKGYTLAGCRLAGWCWWWESEKWPIFFFSYRLIQNRFWWRCCSYTEAAQFNPGLIPVWSDGSFWCKTWCSRQFKDKYYTWGECLLEEV